MRTVHYWPGKTSAITCGVATDAPGRFTKAPEDVTCRGCRRTLRQGWALRNGMQTPKRWARFCSLLTPPTGT